MKKILILGMLAIVGCQTTQQSSQIPTSTETKVTTTTSQVTETVAPTPTILTTLPPLSIPTPTIIQTLSPLPPLTTQKTPLTIAPNIDKPIPSSQKLAANIRSSVGCGVVNEEYRTKVAAMALALANPKATEQLTEPQFYQAVKQNIINNQAKTNNLIAEFRASNCGAQSKNVNTKTQKLQKPQKAPIPTDKVILEQSGSCQDLNARGISNINVQINPWAKALDQDKDGIACESN
ncbi:MAG: excalibur calcium-binding domain-containing protein [Calothrix sp. FI2-JRJ7]|jgi:hypothetical protein|nr:excalibur calcium-binding domain-containing protein [Calothrix sp. FI2-JRJ7]